MALLKLQVAGAVVLKKKAMPVADITPAIRTLADDMAETLKAAHGLALAAPQVGESVRLVVIDRGYLEWEALSEEERKKVRCEYRPEALINPEIVKKEGGDEELEEGCLSVPGYRAAVKRARIVTYRWRDLGGVMHERRAEGLEAVCIQHELDHLDGVLFIDRISRLKRNLALGKVKKFVEELDPEEDEAEYRLYGKP
ncbi:MAG TPA: peptide deformylase [bacterium]|nr:peptide deformylase [bacterium]